MSTVSKLLASRMGNAKLIKADIYLNATDASGMDWGMRLEEMWSNTIKEAKAALSNYKDVIIDAVIEDELPLLKKTFKGLDIYYCILIASEEELYSRILLRGDPNLVSRSLVLLKQFNTDPKKKPYLLDTTGLSIAKVVNKVIDLEKL